jgi:hypothetical protein
LLNEYFIVTLIKLVLGRAATIILSNIIDGNTFSILDDISDSNPSNVSWAICSNINERKPPPKLGLSNLSPGSVKKKLIKLFFIASVLV